MTGSPNRFGLRPTSRFSFGYRVHATAYPGVLDQNREVGRR